MEICPKCGSKEILTHQPGILTGEQSYLRIGGPFWRRAVTVKSYVCTDCGFMENFANKEDLPTLKSQLSASRHPLED